MQRIFIVDPVCVKESGHNLAALIGYGKYFSSLGFEVILVHSKVLPWQVRVLIPAELNPVGIFHHYYIQSIPLEPHNIDEAHKRILDLPQDAVSDYISNLALVDINKLMQQFEIEDSDIIFVPSADYFLLSSIIHKFESLDHLKLPALVIRWIGVMETVSYSKDHANAVLNKLADGFKRLASSSLRLRHCCESSRYANLLATMLDDYVHIAPTLAQQDYSRLTHGDPFTLNFPGASRLDKGFLRISNIIRILKNDFCKKDFQIVVQMLNANELSSCYTELLELGSFSETFFLPCTISADLLNETFVNSDLIVTPYSEATYKLRSSAIMAESISIGRPIVASANCGFSDELVYFSAGKVASTDQEFAAAIFEYMEMPIEKRERYALQARYRFNKYVQFCYAGILENL